ncbi:hypothetical protein [Pontibacter ramchanderi]|uniref:Uncharacterized protein n=1 Tax=Pontibacter ramchanderi TaxID=1179743 RepID=A0A2N3V162_9BACT|nr:hypothetical protein [Pontibacter ramchanderi]PKV75371.1 hypothetical protein BD749_0313 [Pontibacter ramchanderi]
MEDFKLILYILAIVAYFIYTAWRKAFKTPEDDGRPPAPHNQPPRERPDPRPMPASQPQTRQQRPAVPATSFEDILKEMQRKMERANETERPSVESPKPVLQPVTQPVAKDREPRRTALSLENPEQAKLYNQQRRERQAAADALFDAKKYERKTVPNVYGELLHNPQSVRQAFILSEIFNRKQY